MPAQALGLGLSLLEDGVHGALSLDGKKEVRTLDGQKLLASSFLSTLSSQSVHLESVSKSLVTIEEWLKAGGKEEAETKRQTTSSGESMTSQLFTNALLSHVTSPAKRTRLMGPLEAYTPQHPCYYQPSTSLRTSNSTSLTMTANLFPVSMISRLAEMPPNPSQSLNETMLIMTQMMRSAPSTTLNGSSLRKPSNRLRPNEIHPQNPPTIQQTLLTTRPAAYSPRLTPNPSILCPHCLA